MSHGEDQEREWNQGWGGNDKESTSPICTGCCFCQRVLSLEGLGESPRLNGEREPELHNTCCYSHIVGLPPSIEWLIRAMKGIE